MYAIILSFPEIPLYCTPPHIVPPKTFVTCFWPTRNLWHVSLDWQTLMNEKCSGFEKSRAEVGWTFDAADAIRHQDGKPRVRRRPSGPLHSPLVPPGRCQKCCQRMTIWAFCHTLKFLKIYVQSSKIYTACMIVVIAFFCVLIFLARNIENVWKVSNPVHYVSYSFDRFLTRFAFVGKKIWITTKWRTDSV